MRFESPPFTIHYATLTDIGRVRLRNEDRCSADPALRMLLIADGMGGHAAGDVASTLALETTCAHFQHNQTSTDSAAARLHAAVVAANAAIYRASMHQGRAGMGTTIAAALFDDRLLHVAHVGDSRIYRLRENTLEQLTRDHSWVQQMIDRGFYTEERARLSPRRNQLLRALGAMADVEVDIASHELRNGDRYLLCSDGLSGMIDHQSIVALLSADEPPHERARMMIDVANANGGRDNVSVAIADVNSETSA